MKKCEHFKELILTDYIDGELDKNLKPGVEKHLLECNDCRVFLKEVKNNALMLPVFVSTDVLRQPVPVELWDAIKQSLEHENQQANPQVDFLERLKGLIFFPRIVPVFASLTLMLLVGSVTLNNMQVQQAKAKDQGEYLVSLLSPADASSVSDNDGGTPIEHYFL